MLSSDPQIISDLMVKKHQGSVEKWFEELVDRDDIYYNWKNWQVLDTGRYIRPDFVVKGQRKVIEVFENEHSPAEVAPRIYDYQRMGYLCLIVWEFDIVYNPCDVVEDVGRFIGRF